MVFFPVLTLSDPLSSCWIAMIANKFYKKMIDYYISQLSQGLLAD